MKIILVLIFALFLMLAPVGFASTDPYTKVDEFSFIRCDDELMRMFHYRDYLNNNPNANGYLIVYGGQMDKRGAAEAHASRLKDLLINNLGISAERFAVIVGGYRAKWTVELWAGSRAATIPTPAPTVQTNDVRFRKGSVKKVEYKWTSACS